MYKQFHIKNFRCFQDLEMNDLARVNLISGKNNVGKTALLEALFLHCGFYNPALVLSILSFRGIEKYRFREGYWEEETPLYSIFTNFDTILPIELFNGERTLSISILKKPEELRDLSLLLQGNITQDTNTISPRGQVLQFTYSDIDNQKSSYYLIPHKDGITTEPYPPNSPFPASFRYANLRPKFKEVAQYFKVIKDRNQGDLFLNFLKILEPRLRHIEILPIYDEPVLHGDIGLSRLTSLTDMGQGMMSLAAIFLQMGYATNGVLLIDEIENGLHHSILEKVWTAIGQASQQFNTQIFATTHSMDCIQAAHCAFSANTISDFRYHRLDRIGDKIDVKTYEPETLDAAFEMNFEVR